MDILRQGFACAMTTLVLIGCGAPPEQSLGSEVDTADVPGVIHPERWPELTPAIGHDVALEARINDLLSRMTIEEKVGQTLMAEVNGLTPEDVRTYKIGSILAGGSSAPGGDIRASAETWLSYADDFYAASTDTSDGGVGIPILWGIDAVHGHNNIIGATIFPHNIGLGAAQNADLVRRIGEVTALEMRATGQEWNFAPSLYVPRDGRWGRVYEGFSEEVSISGPLAAAAIEGLQGKPDADGFAQAPYVIATAKTWLGDGDMAGGRDQGDVLQDEATMRDIHSAPFARAIEAGAQTVMASFSSYHGRAMHGHQPLLTQILRERYKFDGLVVGDWDGHRKIDGCTPENCPDALMAGLDVYMAPQSWRALRTTLIAQAKDGTLPMATLDEAVRRILRVKLRMGLFEAGPPSTRGVSLDLVGAADHWALAREAVRQSLVLLKNDGVLPVRPGVKILVTGHGADNIPMQNGGWSLTWQGTETDNTDFPDATSLIEGLRAAVLPHGGEVVHSEDGTYTDIPDVAIVAFGETPYAEWRGDQTDVDFSDEAGLVALRRFQEAGIPTVAVFFSGRPLYTNPEINASDAFVAAWLPGGAGGGIADMLIADEAGAPRYDFIGRLPFSWPKSPDQTRAGDPAGGAPLFPVGYGASYAEPVTVGVLEEVDHASIDTGADALLFSRGTLMENSQFVAVIDGRETELGDAKGSTPNGEIEVIATDRAAQEDAREIRWVDAGEVMIKSAALVPADTSATLHMEVARITALTGTLSADLDCVGGGSARINLTEAIRDLSAEAWTTLSFPLKCEGEHPTNRIGLRLRSDTALTLRISELRITVTVQRP